MGVNMNNELYKKYREMWIVANNAAKGYAVGDANDSPVEACAKEGWEILFVPKANDQICIARKSNGSIVGVGDGHGPWAVDLERSGGACTRA